MHDQKKPSRTLKKAALTMRLPKELYEELAKSAERELLSVSSEAERRLQRTFQEDTQAGDTRVSALARYVVAGSAFAIQAHGPLDKSIKAQKEVQSVWEAAVSRLLPQIFDGTHARKRIAELRHEQKQLEKSFAATRKGLGLTPVPATSCEGVDLKQGDASIDDGHLVGGAVDALSDEYSARLFESLVGPTEAERRWAEIADELSMHRSSKVKKRHDRRIGVSVKLVSALLRDLTEREKEHVLNELAHSQDRHIG